ncbi:MAG: GYD domain-containing protein [Syntrophorhabdaceae bacterium]|nr:GYD domain-containing protein [Syntrophorhabdaceae bacterium]
MPLYIMLSTLTDEGRKTIKKHPERIEEVNREIEGMGAKVLAQYALLGHYDFISILDAPNNEVITKVSIELGSRGTVHIMTLPAMPVDEFISKMAKI